MQDLSGPYYQEAGACPYLPDRTWGSMFFMGHALPDSVFGRLLEMGFRRSGKVMYLPACRGCQECVPIRVPVRTFRPTRDQRRALKKNGDVRVEIADPEYSDEKLDLYRRFLEARYPGKEETTAQSFRTFFTESFGATREFRYRVGDRLIGVGIVDVAARAASSVYFFFDPDESPRSVGTFSALYEIDFCRRTGRDYLYLGFRVAGCRAMAYKATFRPHELLDAVRGWVPEADFRAETSR